MIEDHFTEEHQAFRATVREFVAREVRPHIDRWEAAGGWPREIWPKMGELGLFGIQYPEEYGGLGLDVWFTVALIEELCGCAAFGFPMATMVHGYMATPPIFRWGTSELRREWLVPAIQGQLVGALGITEPDTGSDVASIRTTAVRRGDEYEINGAKTFITNGASADFIILAAKTDPARGHDGLSLILFPTKTPGFAVGRRLSKLGCHSSDTAELSFSGCRVPARNLIGEEGKGFYYIMENFQLERLVASLGAMASAEWIFRQALDYARGRTAFGRPVASFQVQRHRFADLATEIEAGKLLAYRAAELYEKGQDVVRAVTMAKLYCSELACRVADRCLQVYGGYGYMEEYPAARTFRDVRLLPVGAGTSEIMRELLSRMIVDGQEYSAARLNEPPAAAAGPGVREIFASLPERFRPERADGLAGVFRFVVTGAEPGEYTVRIEGGRCQVEPGTVGEATCTVTLDSRTYVAIETGRGSPQTAFLEGKLQADDLEALAAYAGCFQRWGKKKA